MTLEANAAVEACVNAGVDEVVVNDGHGPMVNLLVEEPHPAARLITGRTKMFGMMEAIDGDFDGCFMLGYHQREGGGDGVLNHTISSQILYDVRVDGNAVGELELNAGTYGVPVALVTGDDALCGDAAKCIPGAVTVPVKQAIDRFSAVTLSSQEARARISAGAVDALASLREGRVKPLPPPSSTVLEVDFKRTALRAWPGSSQGSSALDPARSLTPAMTTSRPTASLPLSASSAAPHGTVNRSQTPAN
jgi:D-amino peptidase